MEALQVLENKIAALVALAQQLRTENACLAEENMQLLLKLEAVEKKLRTDHEVRDELSKEKERTKSVVDNLIERIDSLTGSELRQ